MTQTLDNKKMPYVAPTIEVDEYLVEEGFAHSNVQAAPEFLELTDDNGDNMQGGEYFDISNV